jgi:hypothetical protein
VYFAIQEAMETFLLQGAVYRGTPFVFQICYTEKVFLRFSARLY